MALLVYQTDIYIYYTYNWFKLIQYNISTFNHNDIHNKPLCKKQAISPYEFFFFPRRVEKSAFHGNVFFS